MKILAIETSCDDTGIAILEGKNNRLTPLANVVSSQAIHQNYGGVFPMMAKREHQKNLIPVLVQALKKAKLLKKKRQDIQAVPIGKILEREQELLPMFIDFLQAHQKPGIDAIAVTQGPGLEPCLWVGVNAARTLAYAWNVPLIPVNHIEAHILVNCLENKKIDFPAIALVVSGGHTQLILMKKIGNYQIIGETRDDAAGECFDKVAKMLGLGYPGGPAIARLAEQWKSEIRNPKSELLKFPRPMEHSGDYDFSFSGLKTAVLYEIKGKKLTVPYIQSICREVQQAAIDVLAAKTFDAVKKCQAKTIILGGGVSANRELRNQFRKGAKQVNIPVIFPEPKLSTDNGLMIAVAASFHTRKTASWKTLKANANLRIGN